MISSPSSVTRLRLRRRFRSLLAFLLLVGLAFAAWVWLPAPVTAVPLVNVIDGDSLTVRQADAPLLIRLIGIDAVEYRQDCAHGAARWPCGREARMALERFAGGKTLHCEMTAKDRYGRTLATCRTALYPDGIDVGAEMVRLGWAVATDDAYMVEEHEAQTQRRGIWKGSFVRPADWRASHQGPATAMTPPDG